MRRYGCKCGRPMKGSCPLDGVASDIANSRISEKKIGSESLQMVGECAGERLPSSMNLEVVPMQPVGDVCGERR